MSFWSKLGLADAATLAVMREELGALRSENTRLLPPLTEQIAQQHGQITEDVKRSSDSIAKDLAFLIEQSKVSHTELNKILQTQVESKEAFLSFKTDVIEQIREMVTATQKRLDTLYEEETAQRESVRSTNEASLKNQETIVLMLTNIAQMAEDSIEASQKSISEIHSTIYALSERSKEIYQLSSVADVSLKEMSESTQKFHSEILAAIQNIASYREEQDKRIGDMEKYLYALWEATKLVWINDLIDESDLGANS